MNLKFFILSFFLFYMIANIAHIMATPTTPPPPPYTPPPPPSLPSFQGSRSPISIISWNGEYFLIGTYEGQIVKYEGEYFSLLKDFKTPISDIVWSGKQWLISGGNLLASYDGSDFEVLSKNYEVSKILCTNKYCLILNNVTGILKFDGRKLEDLSTRIQEIVGRNFLVIDLEWSEKEGYWSMILNEELIEYDGNSFTLQQHLSQEFKIILKSEFSLAWNDKYWLVGGQKSEEPALFHYDGKLFTEVIYPKDVFSISGGNVPSIYIIPQGIAWNGRYWIIDTAYSLVIYDGSNFEKIEYTTASPYTPYRIKQMKWNGKYWLVLYSLAGTNGSALAKLEDKKLEWLSYPSFSFPTQWPPISSINWNGSYWLIGISYHPMGEEEVLLKYDGKTFTDLTEDFNMALQSQETPQPQKSGFSISIFFISLIVIFAFLWHKFKKL